jgi:hypothetical protein
LVTIKIAFVYFLGLVCIDIDEALSLYETALSKLEKFRRQTTFSYLQKVYSSGLTPSSIFSNLCKSGDWDS